MSVAAFDFTERARPFVEVGVGDSRMPTGGGQWDVSRWDEPTATWSGVEPSWLDVSCDVRSFMCEYGRARSTDRFVVGVANVEVDNRSGWADPNTMTGTSTLTMRPGRAIRMGVDHALLGRKVLFRGFIDGMTPTYTPADTDSVMFACVDALGEVNRAKLTPLPAPVGANETATARINRLLNAAAWAATKRRLDPSSTKLIAHTLGGQLADLLGQAADSAGGSIYGDREGNVTFRGRDWQVYTPGTPTDGTIGNVEATDVCPVAWERPFLRADLATRVIIGRDLATAQVIDDTVGQALYGIEPFERIDLLSADDYELGVLGRRILAVRQPASAPRIRSVTLDASTTADALDLMTTVDVFKPSRYRCRLAEPRGEVFDAEHLATGVVHEVTGSSWSLLLNLDLAAPYAIAGGRWDEALWDRATWSSAVLAATEQVRHHLAVLGATP